MLILAAIVGVQPTFAVSATTTNPQRPAMIKEAREAIQLKRQEIQTESVPDRGTGKNSNEMMRLEKEAERCTKLHATIDARIKKFEENHTDRRKQLNIVGSRVLEFATRREAKGFDVSTIRSSLEVYNSKLHKLDGDHAAYIEKIRATKQFVCPGPQGESREQLKTALKETKDAQRLVFEDMKDVTSYFKSVLKPALDAIRPAPGAVEKSPQPQASKPATLLPVENR